MALKSFWSLQEVTEKGFASKQLTINKGFCSWLIEDPKKQLIILKLLKSNKNLTFHESSQNVGNLRQILVSF